MPVDSDLDLQDAVDHANAQDRPYHGSTVGRGLNSLADLGAAGTITPVMLAKHHLPGILLENGPLAIRHIMGYLTTSVPGFVRIPPARARRLVVTALDGRVGGGEQGGAGGDIVIFEKVGWGRWDARRRGHSARDARPVRPHQNPQATHQPPMDHSSESHMAGDARPPIRRQNIASGMSIPGAPVGPTHRSEADYLDHEAEKMSLDGDNSRSSPATLQDSLVVEDDPTLREDSGESTDEEDWASIGAAALRFGYNPLNRIHPRAYNPYPHPTRRDYNARSRGGGPPSSIRPKPASRSNSPHVHHHPHHHSQTPQNHVDFSASPLPDGGLCANNPQEREAIEALVKLKNV